MTGFEFAFIFQESAAQVVDQDWTTLGWTLGFGALAGLAAWLTARSSGAAAVTKAAIDLLKPYETRVTLLEQDLLQTREELSKVKQRLVSSRVTQKELLKRLTKAEAELTRVTGWAETLVRQVVDLGGVPITFDEFVSMDDRNEGSEA